MIRRTIHKIFPENSTGRIILRIMKQYPLCFFSILAKSFFASARLTKKPFSLCCLVYPGMSVRISVQPGAESRINGFLIFRPFLNGKGISSITLSRNSKLVVNGDFEIGQGVLMWLGSSAEIILGGKLESSGSGITANTIVMAEKQITIGPDTIISWGCTISDSDSHDIMGSERCIPIQIGRHVWIGHDVSIIKGASVPDDCIIAAKSLVTGSKHEPCTLLAGTPAVAKKYNIQWQR